MNYFLSIDVGTHAIKTALFIENLYAQNTGKKIVLLKYSSVELPHTKSMICDKNTLRFTWQEQFTQTLVLAVRHVCCALNKDVIQNDCLYITVSGNGPSLVCANNKNEVVAFTSWQDLMSDKEHMYLKHTKSYFLPQLQYLRQYEAQVFSQIAWVLPPAEYAAFLLSGKKNIWVPHDEYAAYIWNTQDIKRYNFDSLFFASAATSGSIIGLADTSFAQNMCGSFQNTYLVAGGLDYLSALIGANVKKNTVFQRSGTSVVLNIVLEKDSYFHNTLPNDLQHHFILPHFFKQYVNIGFPVPNFEKIYKRIRASSVSNNEGKQYDDLLAVLVNTYNELLYAAGMTAYNDVFTISGGHAHDSSFIKMCAKGFGLQVKTFTPVYCELLGNLALGIKASGAKTYIEDAIEYVSNNVDVCLYR